MVDGAGEAGARSIRFERMREPRVGQPWQRVRYAIVAVLTAVLVSSLFPLSLDAQYFGRNKVKYDDFDFHVLHTDHFDIHHYAAEADRSVQDFGRMAERWYDRLARTFQHEFEVRKPIIVYRNQADFQQTNAIPGFISQATGGVTESVKDRVILPFAQSYAETDHVLGHELVHAFQYDLARASSGGGPTAIGRAPLWLVEGMAEYLSLGRTSAHTAMWMRDAVLHDRLPSIQDLVNPQEYFPYRFGHALWAYVAGVWGDEAVGTLYRAVGERGVPGAISSVLGVSADSLATAWHHDTRAHFGPLLEGRTRGDQLEQRLLSAGAEDGQVHLAPELSPDGDRLVVLSQQTPFSIDLFVVDARTGEVEGRLASANADPHFEALAFTNTTGAWSPDGQSFAFVTFRGGDNEIALADVEDRSVRRTYDIGDVGAIFGLSWSPDGDHVAFSGSRAGVTDLFVLDLQSGTVRSLTDDRFAEWHPSWSPDGSKLVFATDRGPGSDLSTLQYQDPGIGVLDVQSGRITLHRFFDAKHIDPAFAPDGRSIYFVSDPDGFSDVYRGELETRTVHRVTRVATGVSGLTEMSPALTVASDAGRIAFTVFDRGGYTVAAQTAGEPAEEPVCRGDACARGGVLPPLEPAPRRLVSSYLETPSDGLPPANPAWTVTEYDADLQFDYLAQPSVGIAVDQFGTALGGSVAAVFSDMLGDHNFGVALSVNGGIEDIGGEAAYMDRGDRLDWGLRAGRIPIRQGFVQTGTSEIDGTPARAVDLVISRTIFNSASTLLSFPLSQTRRVEASVGGTRIAFDRDIRRSIVLNGQVVDERTIDADDPSAINLANASLAYVQDNSVFGFTSPVSGGRMRLEVEGNVGTLDYGNLLADAREYLFFEPVTLALRGMHFGRYGGDAESPRLTPLFLGQGSLVRGYTLDSFGGDECTEVPGAPQACPEFDRLIGTRILVGNVELRVPLFGTEQFGLVDIGFLPTEASLFADAGLAWTSEEDPAFELTERSTERIPVASAGASLRFNILGRLVGEFYYAHPFQRPEAGGQFGFQFLPGW